jgi:polyhydroxybutyrate depolymerase
MLSLALLAVAQTQTVDLKLEVDGTERSAVVCLPSKGSAHPPIVFAFHGHGGSSEYSFRRYQFHEAWPQALVVYPEGLPTASPRVDKEGKFAGWQMRDGDQADRDLHFFDAMFERLERDYKFDLDRVFVMGHSNGGGFACLLWADRGSKLAGVAYASAGGSFAMRRRLKPLPAFISAGEKDALVPFEGQMLSLKAVKDVLGVVGEGKNGGLLTVYKGSTGCELDTYIHPGGHEFLPETTPLMVQFFKRQRRRA